MTNLKQMRIEKGYTQKFVYRSLGMSQDTYSRYETGKFTPALHTACRIAEFYGLETIKELKELFEKQQ